MNRLDKTITNIEDLMNEADDLTNFIGKHKIWTSKIDNKDYLLEVALRIPEEQIEPGYQVRLTVEKERGILLGRKIFDIIDTGEDIPYWKIKPELQDLLLKTGIFSPKPSFIQILLIHLLGG